MDWSSVTDWLTDHGVKILIIIVVAGISYLLARKAGPRSLNRTLSNTMKGYSEVEIEKRRLTLTNLFFASISIVIIIIALFLILAELGINIAALIAGFGVVGIAVGLGAQNLVKDLIAGFVIMLENQFNIGDVIDVADKRGTVEAINLRRTLIRDLDGILHVIPNGEIKTTGNYTRSWSRAHLNLSVAYKEDLDQVMAIVKETWETLAKDPVWGSALISQTPSILRVNDFGDSGIEIKMVGETQPLRQWEVMGEYRRRIKRIFDEQGIEIPWPHSKVYFGDGLHVSSGENPTQGLPDQGQGAQPSNTVQVADSAGKAGTIFCNQCGNESPSSYKFCPRCGTELAK